MELYNQAESTTEIVKVILARLHSGYDVHTVFDEALNGEVDEQIAETCRQEQRALITLDTDISRA